MEDSPEKSSAASVPPQVYVPRCHACGAELVLGAHFCWLCGAPQSVLAEVVEKPGDEPPTRGSDEMLGPVACWAAAILVALIGFGVYATEPWQKVAYAVAVVPAFLIALGGAAIGRATGSPWHPVLKFGIFVAVLGVSVPLGVVVLIYGMVVSFLQVCFPAR